MRNNDIQIFDNWQHKSEIPERSETSEVYNCPRLLPGELPGCSAEKGNPNRTRGLSELRRQSLEFEKAKATRVSGAEYQRGGHCPEKTLRRLKRGCL